MVDRNLHIIRISAFLLIIIVFSAELLYCQTDSILVKKTDKSNTWTSFESERFSVSLGSFISIDNTGITIGSRQLGIGIIIDIEDALGLETSSFVFRGCGSYKFGRKKQHALAVDYFSINRNASKVLETDLEFGDNIYTVGTKLESKFNLSIIRAKYEYAFLHNDRVSMGFSTGLFIMPLNFSLKSDNAAEQRTSMVAPLPLLGLHSDFLISNKFVLKESVEMLYLKVDNFTGSILDMNFALEYNAFRNLGFGLGVNLSRLNISAKGSDYPEINFFGSIKMEYNGALLYIRFYL